MLPCFALEKKKKQGSLIFLFLLYIWTFLIQRIVEVVCVMQCFKKAVPNRYGTRDWFCGRQFFQGPAVGEWFQDNPSPLHLLCLMAPHSSTLAWKIPWTEEPSRLQSMGSLGVRHDWATPLSLFTFMHWRRKWQPTPVFLPGESQGRGAWWAAVYGVAQSWTRLKWLSIA